MLDTKENPYRVSDNHDMDPSYQLLIGPNGFKCRLTEPEDRTFHRDLAILVDELNRLYIENNVLLYKIDELNYEIEYIRETSL